MDDKQYTEELAKNIAEKLRGKQTALKFDNTPTEGSVNPVTSEGIKEYVDKHSGEKYLPGDNISIDENGVISASDTKYTPGNGIDMINNEISIDTDVVALKEDIPVVPTNYVTTNTGQTISGAKIFTNVEGIQSRSSVTSTNRVIINGTDSARPYVSIQKGGSYNDNVTLYSSSLDYLPANGSSNKNFKIISHYMGDSNKVFNYQFKAPEYSDSTKTFTVATTEDIPTISGTNDGVNWTALTIGTDNYGIGSVCMPNLDDPEWVVKEWDTSMFYPSYERYGDYIWSDGNNTYYSYGSDQFVLNKNTLTWEAKTWKGLPTSFHLNGYYIWTDGNNIYYSFAVNSSSYSYYYRLDKDTDTWIKQDSISSYGAEPPYIWTDGDNIYTSYEKGNISSQRIFNKETLSWENKTWSGLTRFYGYNIWTDGEDIYYSGGRPGLTGTFHYVLDKATSTWTSKTWTNFSNFVGSGVWSDGNNYYYTSSSTKYIFDKINKTWVQIAFPGCNNSYNNRKVWTDGNNIYLWRSRTETYILNYRNTKKVNTVSLAAVTGSYNDLKDKPNVEYYAGSYIDITNNNISVKTDKIALKTDIKDSTITIKQNNVIKDTFTLNAASDKTINIDYGLNTPNGDQEWTNFTWGGDLDPKNLSTGFIWRDGENIYCSLGTKNYILDKATHTWVTKNWYDKYGSAYIEGSRVWTDGENIYFNGNGFSEVLNRDNDTWYDKTWIGLAGSDMIGSCIWTDGTNIYYSEHSKQYALDKATSTWTQKTWNGYTPASPANIWTDGENIYFSDGSNQYILDKDTSTWNQKTWNGLTSFGGYDVWTDGNNIYCSWDQSGSYGTHTQYHYRLDKFTSTWIAETITSYREFDGRYAWSDDKDTYYSNGSIAQYKLSPSYSSVSKLDSGKGIIILNSDISINENVVALKTDINQTNTLINTEIENRSELINKINNENILKSNFSKNYTLVSKYIPNRQYYILTGNKDTNILTGTWYYRDYLEPANLGSKSFNTPIIMPDSSSYNRDGLEYVTSLHNNTSGMVNYLNYYYYTTDGTRHDSSAPMYISGTHGWNAGRTLSFNFEDSDMLTFVQTYYTKRTDRVLSPEHNTLAELEELDAQDPGARFEPVEITEANFKADTYYVKTEIAVSYIDSELATDAQHILNKSNPHNVTKAQIGLSNVDNTADIDKPISNAVQTALNNINIKIPDAPTIAGTYTLQVVVDNEGNPTYSWIINS